jgi:hypothetical protein
MKNKDQTCIYESYRDEILSKFKKSIEPSNSGMDSAFSKVKTDEDVKKVSESIQIDSDDVDVDFESELSDDEPVEKRNVIVRSGEVSIKLDPNLREIVRILPNVIEDVDILKLIKKAIEKVNDDLTEFDQKIEDSPLSIYDKLMDAGVYSEEEVTGKDERLKSNIHKDDLDDDTLTVDDYFDDDDFSGESDFNLSKKTQKEREDIKSGMRRDIERSRAEDILKQMGVDFNSDRDFDDDF